MVRKLIHVSLAAVPLVGWLLDQRVALVLAALLLLGSILLELARRGSQRVDRVLWGRAPGLFRPSEQHSVLGSTWYCASMLAVLAVFGQGIGGMSVLFLAFGDPAAELAGRRWGDAGKRKTGPGSLACLFTCAVVATTGALVGQLPVAVTLTGAAAAAIAERWAPPPGDNVWVPLFSALAMAAVRQLLSV